MGKIFRCLSGSVTILVRGNQLERFLNLCRSRNISMEHIRRKEGQITARIKIRDFFRLRPVRNKTGVHIQVTEKQGMPFFFYEGQKKEGFFCRLFTWTCIAVFPVREDLEHSYSGKCSEQ